MATVSELAEQTSPIPPPVELTEAELFANDPLLSAVGLYKDLWADEHADEYVANLRKDW
jgi:hypothetical protein